MKTLCILLVLLICSSTVMIRANSGNTDLLEQDKQFSTYCSKNGIYKAYLKFMAKDGVIFPQIGHPIVGIKELKQIHKKNSTIFQDLSIPDWEPQTAIISEKGDLGFTYGKYQLPSPGDESSPKTDHYLTIWKKQKHDEWKIAVNMRLFLTKLDKPAPLFHHKKDPADVIEELKQTEREFSNYSCQHGIAHAFYQYIADNGTVISPDGSLLTKQDYEKMLHDEPAPTNAVLKWEPTYSFMSEEEDMGSNLGPWQYIITNDDDTTIYTGYFLTVWKKQENNSWKFLIDIGNNL